MLGGIFSFVVFGSKAETAHHYPQPQTKVVPHNQGSMRAVEATSTRLSRRELKNTESRVNRESLRRFSSIDAYDLANSEELVEWGISEDSAIEVAAAFAEAVESIRKIEAELSTLHVDFEGNEYLHIPAYSEDSSVVISSLENRLREVVSRDDSIVFTEIISADIFGMGKFRRDELERKIYLTENKEGDIQYHDGLFDQAGEELILYVHRSSGENNSVPENLNHLVREAL